ncbi:MAG: diguanylate cyclase [Meiothermus sp.]|nr:diguanylate cyclase [Meiothermus sp.]
MLPHHPQPPSQHHLDVRELVAEASELVNTNPLRGRELGEQAVRLAEASGQGELIAVSLQCLGSNLFSLGEYWMALERFLESLGWYQQLEHPQGQAAAYHSVGAVYLQLGEYAQALQFLSLSLGLREKLGRPAALADTLNNIAIAYSSLDDFERSRTFHLRALELRQQSGDPQGQGLALNGLGYLYLNQALRAKGEGDLEREQELLGEALAVLDEALELARQTGNLRMEVSALNNLASVHSELGLHAQALHDFEAAYGLSRDLGDPLLEASLLADMGRSHCHLGDLRVGLGYLHDAAGLFEQLGSKDEAAYVHLDLCQVYERGGEYAAALEHHKRYHQGRLASQSEAAERAARALSDRLELERTRREAELHKLRYAEVSQQNAELQARAEHLDRQVRQDSLTGIANRRYLDKFLAGKFVRAKAQGEPLSLVFADIDHFKKVNDGFSHQVGDAALRQVAQILEQHCRPHDLVARYGGEEFVLVLPGTEGKAAWQVCERMRLAVEAFEWNQVAPGLRITLSLGFAEIGTVDSVERLVAKADLELYQAKRSGRNQVSPRL